MNAEILLSLPAVIVLALVVHGIHLWQRHRAALRRAAWAAYRRSVPWSELAGVPEEGIGNMSRQQIDDFMRPEDMSSVRKELEDEEKAGEYESLDTRALMRQRRLGRAAAAAPVQVERPTDESLSDEEREILAQTDARARR